MTNKKSGFPIGLLVGAIAGAVAGILLAPKSGAETRKDLKKFAGETFEHAKDLYVKAQESLSTKIDALKSVGKKIDEKKYSSLVNEVLTELKEDAAVTKEVANAIKKELKKDWTKVKKALATQPATKA